MKGRDLVAARFVLHKAASCAGPAANALVRLAMVGKTVVVIGVGTMGGAGADWANRFRMTVLGIRRSGWPYRSVDRMYKPMDLRRL